MGMKRAGRMDRLNRKAEFGSLRVGFGVWTESQKEMSGWTAEIITRLEDKTRNKDLYNKK